jgi:zinc/manganese transport system ATP-binding protein
VSASGPGSPDAHSGAHSAEGRPLTPPYRAAGERRASQPGATPVRAAAAVTLRDLTLTYDRHPAVHHLSGMLAHGSLTAVVGPNGAGKSTLLEAIAGRRVPSTGRIEIDPALAGRIAYLPQAAAVDRSVPVTVADLVALGDWAASGAFGAVGRAARLRLRQALDAVGLAGFERRLIGELSVGQFQRVLFARLLLQDARLILLDEPFNAVDATTQAALMDQVRRWHDQACTVVVVLHDLEQARREFPQALLLAREPVAWGPTAEVLHAEQLFRARRMAERWDTQAAACDMPSVRAA